MTRSEKDRYKAIKKELRAAAETAKEEVEKNKKKDWENLIPKAEKDLNESVGENLKDRVKESLKEGATSFIVESGIPILGTTIPEYAPSWLIGQNFKLDYRQLYQTMNEMQEGDCVNYNIAKLGLPVKYIAESLTELGAHYFVTRMVTVTTARTWRVPVSAPL